MREDRRWENIATEQESGHLENLGDLALRITRLDQMGLGPWKPAEKKKERGELGKWSPKLLWTWHREEKEREEKQKYETRMQKGEEEGPSFPAHSHF